MVDVRGTAPAYGVVVPVKRATVAKSRLAPLGDDARRLLVTAFAMDTVGAALSCPAVAGVLVVSDEASLTAELETLGVLMVADGHPGRLNASLAQGAAELLRLRPGLRPVALCGDLPALRPDDLARTLAGAPEGRPSFVPDVSGTGTTLYTAPTLAAFRPQFGPRSRDAHCAAGAVELVTESSATVRRDVDTPDDLSSAVALGVGTWTSRTLAQLGLAAGPRGDARGAGP